MGCIVLIGKRYCHCYPPSKVIQLLRELPSKYSIQRSPRQACDDYPEAILCDQAELHMPRRMAVFTDQNQLNFPQQACRLRDDSRSKRHLQVKLHAGYTAYPDDTLKPCMFTIKCSIDEVVNQVSRKRKRNGIISVEVVIIGVDIC